MLRVVPVPAWILLGLFVLILLPDDWQGAKGWIAVGSLVVPPIVTLAVPRKWLALWVPALTLYFIWLAGEAFDSAEGENPIGLVFLGMAVALGNLAFLAVRLIAIVIGGAAFTPSQLASRARQRADRIGTPDN